jgi:hypothetical protein
MSAAVTMPTTTSILDLPDGMHEGIPEAIYHQRIPGVASKSVLDLVDRSPAHYAAWLAGASSEESPALAFGKALHCALLEPHVYRSTYTVEPSFGDCRKTDNKKRRDDWRGANAGRSLLEQADALAIDGMIKSAMAHPRASKMLDEGSSEVTVKWTDAATGIVCKSRADHYVGRLSLCLDVKTTEDARASAFAKSVANYGYHRQAAFYSDGFAAVGSEIEHFVFLAIEKRPPYLVALFNLEDEDIAQGREEIRRSIQTLADCIERGEYPGYPTSIQTLSLPAWAKGKTR